MAVVQMSQEKYQQSRLYRHNKAKEKIDTTLVGMRRLMPFHAIQTMQKPKDLVFDVPTLCTNGKGFKIGVDWVIQTAAWEVESGLVHEVFHDNLLHHIRCIGKDPGVFNEAADIVVNYLMVMAGFKIGDKWLYDPHLGKFSVDIVYDTLMKRKNKSGGAGGSRDQNGKYIPISDPTKELVGEVNPLPASDGKEGPPTPEDKQEAESKERQTMINAANAAKKAGKLPMEIERMVLVATRSKADWIEYVASWMTKITNEDYSSRRPNRRYVQLGYFMPILYSEEVGELIVMGDTSGSIDEEGMATMCNDMHSLLSQYNIQSMTALWVDTSIEGVQEFSSQEEPDFKPKGGGGTSFRPGFEWIEKRFNDEGIPYPVGVIYITDGLCSRFHRPEPEYPVLWVIIDGYLENFRPPYGDVVYRHC